MLCCPYCTVSTGSSRLFPALESQFCSAAPISVHPPHSVLWRALFISWRNVFFSAYPWILKKKHERHFYLREKVQWNNTLLSFRDLRETFFPTVQMSREEEPMWTLWKYSSKLLTWGIAINVTFHHLTDKVTKGGVGGTWVVIVDTVTATTGERERWVAA